MTATYAGYAGQPLSDTPLFAASNTIEEVVVTASMRKNTSVYDFNDKSAWSGPNAPNHGGSAVHPGGPSSPPTQKPFWLNTLRTKLEDTGYLAPTDLSKMQQYGITLNELLKPGVYQVEFAVAVAGEHRHWVKVNATGSSEIISAARNATTGKIEPVRGAWEASSHGLNFGGEMTFRPVPGSINNSSVTSQIWNSMNATMDLIVGKNLNYNVAYQNSNSVAFTLGQSAGIDLLRVGTRYAPADHLDLRDVQPQRFAPLGTVDEMPALQGTAGNDAITGPSTGPATRLVGGDGADVLQTVREGDAIDGGNGDDVLNSFGGFVFGGAGADRIQALTSNTIIADGGDGADTITGSTTHDQLMGGAGADSISGGDGDDVIGGGAGDDVLSGGAGNDAIDGGTENDNIQGNSGADNLTGGDGADTLLGGQDNDQLSGGAGADQLFGDLGDDRLEGGADNDVLSGNAGADVLAGDDGADIVRGGADDDLVSGGKNVDQVFGDLGNDTIIGGPGRDQLTGGAGADVFAFRPNDSQDYSPNSAEYGPDIILDFESGIDKISLTNYGSGLTFQNIVITYANGVTHISSSNVLGVNQLSIDIAGAPSLSASDFIIS